MCSRYSFVPGAGAFAYAKDYLGALADELAEAQTKARFFPTDPVPILIQRTGGKPEVALARWGLIPKWWKREELPRSTFNARSEEAPGKPMWRDPWKKARCLIPATSWYEWRKVEGRTKKVPHQLKPRAGQEFFFAGLWDEWAPDDRTEPVLTCTMLTVAAAPAVAHIHDRMPVVLAPRAWLAWLDPAMTDPKQVRALLDQHTVDSIAAAAVEPR